MTIPAITLGSEAWADEVSVPDVSKLVTEDDTPVDNFFSERQMRLLTESLEASWQPMRDGEPRPYVVAANVGLFATTREPPLVPDVLLSMDVTPPTTPLAKEQRSYFVWEFGKVPDVVIEIVSNKEGGELREKRRRYAHMRVPYYIVYDPGQHLGDVTLQVLRLAGDLYVPHREPLLSGVNLSVGLWTGHYGGLDGVWLRWFDESGVMVSTGAERADAEQSRADAEQSRADAEQSRADAEHSRAERLAARLRALGIDPDAA